RWPDSVPVLVGDGVGRAVDCLRGAHAPDARLPPADRAQQHRRRYAVWRERTGRWCDQRCLPVLIVPAPRIIAKEFPVSLSSFIKKQFIDILQWTESEDGVLAWRYPMQDMEIQNGGTLVVRDSQMAMFVNEGQIADVFGAGTFKLTTQTLPVLTYLKNWDKLFESPFKSDVYYFSTRQQLGRRWGTPQPVTVRDKDFGMIRLRAFGVYAYHVAD